MSPCEKVKPCLMPSVDAQEVRDAGEHGMDRVKHRRDEQERKLDRLGNAREKRGERRGDHDAADLLLAAPGRAARHMAIAAAGRPNILNR